MSLRLIDERISAACDLVKTLYGQIKKADKRKARELRKELRKAEQLLSGLLAMRRALSQANQGMEDKK